MPGPPKVDGRSTTGPHRPRPRRGCKRTRRGPPGRAPHRGQGATSRTVRRSADHRSAPRGGNNLGESAARSRARTETPRPPTDSVGHTSARTGATNDLPGGLAGPPAVPRMTAATRENRFGGPRVRPGRCPLTCIAAVLQVVLRWARLRFRACFSVLPCPDCCRFLRAGGRVRGRGAAAERRRRRPLTRLPGSRSWAAGAKERTGGQRFRGWRGAFLAGDRGDLPPWRGEGGEGQPGLPRPAGAVPRPAT